MTSKSRVLGLAFVAVLAIASAMAASAAQAESVFGTPDAKYPKTVTGTSEPSTGEQLNTEAGSVECEASHYHGTISSLTTTLTLTPNYTNCAAFGFAEATINTEGCGYVFHATEHIGTDSYRAHFQVTCPPGKSIKITAATCEVEIKAQNGRTTVDITNMTAIPVTNNDITVKFTVTSLAYNVTKDGFLCPFKGTGSKSDGEYQTANYITFQGEEGLEVTTISTD